MDQKARLNLIIAGAQRSATTSLKKGLALSPEIKFVSDKETTLVHEGEYVGYPFATPFNCKSMLGHIDGGVVYESIVSHCKPAQYHAAKWPYFMVFPHIACNIRQHLPDARLIFILRNPTDCLWSSFRKRYKGSDLVGDFDRYIDEGIETIENGFDPERRSKWQHMLFVDQQAATTLDRGCYFPQILNFLNLFGWSHTYIINYKDFSAAPVSTIEKLLNWLYLPGPAQNGSDYSILETRHNAAEQHATEEVARVRMDEKTRDRLDDFYRPSNTMLCDLLSWNCDDWMSA